MKYETLSDSELMAAFQSGEMDAFTALYQRHLKGLVNFFFRLSWDRALSEDFCQETLLRVFRLSREWEPSAKFTTFLYRIARNLWIDHLRSARVRRRGGSLDDDVPGAEGRIRYIDLLPSDVRPPADQSQRRETLGEIMHALDQLPEEQRMVFILAEMQGMRYAEIADVMDIPVGTVKSRMHTAVARLQGLLAHLAPDKRSVDEAVRETSKDTRA